MKKGRFVIKTKEEVQLLPAVKMLMEDKFIIKLNNNLFLVSKEIL